MVGDRLQVGDPLLEAVVGDLAVGQAVPALVEPDDGRDLAELVQVVPPDRALPVELQVAQPAPVDEQRRPGPVDGVRDVDPVDRPGRNGCPARCSCRPSACRRWYAAGRLGTAPRDFPTFDDSRQANVRIRCAKSDPGPGQVSRPHVRSGHARCARRTRAQGDSTGDVHVTVVRQGSPPGFTLLVAALVASSVPGAAALLPDGPAQARAGRGHPGRQPGQRHRG